MNFNAFEPGVLIYTIYFFLLLFVTFARYNKSNKENKKYFIFFVLLQVLIGGLRSFTVGTDTGSYVHSIQMYSTFSNDEILEHRAGRDPYFYLFTKLITNFFDSYTGLFFVLQIIFWGLVASTLYKYSKSCLLALMLLVAFRQNYFALSGMRQGIAMALILFSYRYLESRKMIKYFVTIVVAFLCHQSAIIFIPIYFVYGRRLNKWSLIILILVLAIGSSFVLPDISFDEELTYAGYLQIENKGNFFSLFTITLAFIFILIRIHKMKLDEEMNFLFSLSLFAFAISLMAINLDIAYRIAAYFCMFMPIFMSNLLVERKNHQQDVAILLIILIIIYIVTGMPPGLDDYKFFWETNFMDYQS